MKKLALLLAALVAVLVPTVAVADGGGVTVGVAYVDHSIDRPIAEAVAALDRQYGLDTQAVEVATLYLDPASRPDCVVVAGRDGDKNARGLGYYTNGMEVRSAQGDDRHETAALVAEAVAACRR